MTDQDALDRVLVIIPTFNEAQNIESITNRLRRAVPDAHILVADDNSPDGTGAIADRLAASDDHIHVMHRKGKEGLGAAYLAGFHWGLDEGYGVLVQHDADGSHQPEQLPRLLDAIRDGADMVKGSRWVKGGSIVNWPKSRQLISQGGSLWTRIWLGLPVKDATGDIAGAVRKRMETGLTWYSGDDGLFLPFLSVGAVGIISVIAHAAAGPMRDLANAFDRGDIHEAQRISVQLAPLVEAMNGNGFQAVMAKASLKVRGILDSTEMRLPNVGPGEAELVRAEKGMRAAGLL